MTRATFAVYNVHKDAAPATVVGDLEELARHATVLVLNEARAATGAGEGVDRFCQLESWEQSGPAGDVRTLWDPSAWHGLWSLPRKLSDASGVRGIPARYALVDQLRHRESRQRHTFVATHVTAGYADPETDHAQLRRSMACAELLTLAELTAEQLRGQQGSMLHLTGDLNARKTRTEDWWYPTPLLASMYVPDQGPGLIYALHSRAAAQRGLELVKRSTVELSGDHPAAVKTVSW